MIKAPFKNESESDAIDDLTIENRLDRVSIYGRIEITADAEGHQKAIVLHALLSSVLAELEKQARTGVLPEKIAVDAPVPKKNPFK